MAEHRHCRTAAALFDVSHMCQALIRGAGAAQAFERLVPGDVAGLARASFATRVTNEQGGVLDDLIVGRVDEGLFVVANAARRDVDLAHMRQALEPEHRVEELDDRALLACKDRARKTCSAASVPLARAAFMQTTTATVAGVPCRVSRCGYTGEDGFEISVAATDAPALARRLLEEPEVAGRSRRPRLLASRRLVPVRPRAHLRHHAGRGRPAVDHRRGAAAQAISRRRHHSPAAAGGPNAGWSASARRAARRRARAP